MEHELLRKLRAAMTRAGHDALVAFSQDNVTYTAGFLVPSHASNRFRRTMTVLAGSEFATQIVVNVEENLARQRSRFSDIRAYNQFTEDPADVLADVLLEAGVGAGRIVADRPLVGADRLLHLAGPEEEPGQEHPRGRRGLLPLQDLLQHHQGLARLPLLVEGGGQAELQGKALRPPGQRLPVLDLRLLVPAESAQALRVVLAQGLVVR